VVKWQSDDLLSSNYLELEIKPGVRYFERSKRRGQCYSNGRMDTAIAPKHTLILAIQNALERQVFHVTVQNIFNILKEE
jgi:hypothetical protein